MTVYDEYLKHREQPDGVNGAENEKPKEEETKA